MWEETLVRHCAPTLAHMKTANLFACRFDTPGALCIALRETNRRLVDKGLRAVPLRYGDGVGLVYVYRPGMLAADLADARAQRLLQERGYPCGQTDLCVKRLQRRLVQGEDFPHEIGLFLGYPPEDVEGFINKGQAKCTGCWKVYGDVETAQRTFRQFKACTAAYIRLYAAGHPLERLALQ